MAIRLVTFDALFTLVRPRQPIYVQYAQVFEPHLGVLEPSAIKREFKSALKALQVERPAYAKGAEEWWAEVIRRTALGAGASSDALAKSLPEIVPTLLHRFSSKEGYAFYDDAVPTIRALQRAGIQVGMITNADARIASVLDSLCSSSSDGDGTPLGLAPLVISEQLGEEKPAAPIFHEACRLAGVHAAEVLHVGDELEADYRGATGFGMHARLLRRVGSEEAEVAKEAGEDLRGVSVVESLHDVLEVVHGSY